MACPSAPDVELDRDELALDVVDCCGKWSAADAIASSRTDDEAAYVAVLDFGGGFEGDSPDDGLMVAIDEARLRGEAGLDDDGLRGDVMYRSQWSPLVGPTVYAKPLSGSREREWL